MDRKKIKTITILLGMSIFLFSSFFLFTDVLASNTGDIVASVSIINPLGPYAEIKAVPEKRIPNILTRVYNRQSWVRIKAYTAGSDRSNPANLLYNSASTTNDLGWFSYYVFDGLSPGTYDFTVKGYSHLTRLVSNVSTGYAFALDFSDNGTNPLLSGDINLTEGDDEINAMDISVLVNAWNTSDSRADLNRDEEVNSIDISNLLANFNAVGD
ncbi:hypothetical protein KJ785_01400 [Patescibacteria group bacterium]|nr:hypothetical protein [Patescibacteria group bacterium]